MDEDEFDAAKSLRTFNGWVAAVDKVRGAGDLDSVEEGNSFLFKMASNFLLAHVHGQAALPREVASWLHMQLKGALHADAARVLHGSVRNLRGPVEVAATSYAAGFIARGPGGDARGAKTKRVREVVERYGVSERRAFAWKEERPAFDNVMAKVQPGQDRDAVALEYLDRMADQYRGCRQPMGK